VRPRDLDGAQRQGLGVVAGIPAHGPGDDQAGRRPRPPVQITDPPGEPGGLAEQGAGRSVIILPQPQQAQRVERLGPDR
jgi:hypothetical protein